MRTQRRETWLPAIILLLAACTAAPPPSDAGTPGRSTAPSASADALPSSEGLARPPLDEIPTDGSCDEDRICLGVLEPGRHEVTYFEPPFSFRVEDEGWVNVRASGGLVLFLDRTAPGDELSIYQGARARTFDNKLVAGQGRSPEEFVAWLAQRADLAVTSPEATTVGGLHGWWMDVTVLQSAPRGLSDCPAEPCVAIASGIEPTDMPTWEWELRLWARAAYRIYALDADGRTVLIVMTAWDEVDLPGAAERMGRIVDSMAFTPSPT